MKTNIIRLLTLVMLAAGAAACDSGPDSPTGPPVFVGPAELQITELRIGTGATVVAGQTVDAGYSLWLYDPGAAEFKGTHIQTGRTAIRLASGSVIQGWIAGVPGMKVGGVRRLLIPPSLGYGATGNQGIPGNAWLVFDIEIFAATN